ncbi:MAG: MFS transporter [Rhodospirillaceae bacterium]|nr:MFS transporter [Rhodospirillaceae bacterium]
MPSFRTLFFPRHDQRLALATASAEGKGLPAPRRYVALATILLGLTLAVLDGTIANVALPSIARHFHAEAAESIWIVNGYQLAIVMSLLPLAALADIYGYRTVYLGGVVLFTAASVACILAESMEALTAARIAQGLGAAGLMAVNMSMLRFSVARGRFGAAIGVNAMVVAVASTVGPVLAGAILSVASWHWLFAINIPLGLLTLLIGVPSLPETLRRKRRFDWLSALLSAIGIGLVIMVIDGIGAKLPLYVTGLQILGCILCFVLQIRHERGSDSPMLPVDLLRIPIFSLSICTSILSFTTQFLAFVSLPFLLQSVMHFSPTMVGMLMTPWPLAVAVTAPLSGRMSDRYPPAILGGVGLLCLSAGMLALGLMQEDAQIWDIAWRMALCGAGFGLFQAPNNRAMQEATPMERTGAASGMMGTARLTGQSVGAALVALMLHKLGLWGATGALLLGSVFAFLAAIASMSRLVASKAKPKTGD